MDRAGRKAIYISMAILVGIPIFYFSVKHGLAYMKPEIYDGDRVETRRCRQCRGSGKDAEMGREYPALGDCCPFCRGKGLVEVIIPGPKRPIRFWGTVVRARAVGDAGYIPMPRNRRMPSLPFGGGPPPVPGAIAEARVVFRPESGEEIAIVADAAGKFSRRIPPGSYTVTVSAPGFDPVSKEIDLPPLTEPIWLEKATLIDPDEGTEEARGARGMDLFAGLARDDEDGGFIRIEPAAP